jgi:hypothetical protein
VAVAARLIDTAPRTIAELNPARDPSGVTSRVATWIVTHALSEILERPR